MVKALLTSTENELIPLQAVNVHANLNGILAEVEVSQHFLNEQNVNIETVYSFPLPLDAVLIDIEVVINQETLKGCVTPKQSAAQEYEEAIEAGNTAVLLSKVSPGFYSLNLGNLMGQESAIIKIKYAQLLQWQGEQLRFFFPTTFTPRYGDPSQAGFKPHEQPSHHLLAEYPFDFELQIEGELTKARVTSMTHHLATAHQQECTSVVLSETQNTMDRDLVISITKPSNYVGEALTGKDFEGYANLASLCPPTVQASQCKGRNLKIVVDCSGSMMGDSIEQAKLAVYQILASLGANDYFNIVQFGSSTKSTFDAMVKASPKQVQLAMEAVEAIDADMGGTEMQFALEQCYSLKVSNESRNEVLLITDGEIWDVNPLIESAVTSNHRHFVIGVGTSVNEAFLTDLARSTKGAVEFVNVNDDMAKRIVRHVNRIDQPQIHGVNIDWTQPVQANDISNSELYLGDTSNHFSWSTDMLGCSPEYVYQLDDEHYKFSLPIASVDTKQSVSVLARLAAYEKIKSMTAAEATELAQKYQLVTEYTSFILVKQQVDAEEIDLPVLKEVPHQMPAGTFGLGTESMVLQSAPSADVVQVTNVMSRISSHNTQLDYLEMPAFLRKREVEEKQIISIENWLEYVLKNSMSSEFCLESLKNNGEDEGIVEILERIMEETSINESDLFVIWLKLRSKFFNKKLSIRSRIAIKGWLRKRSINKALVNQVNDQLLEQFNSIATEIV